MAAIGLQGSFLWFLKEEQDVRNGLTQYPYLNNNGNILAFMHFFSIRIPATKREFSHQWALPH